MGDDAIREDAENREAGQEGTGQNGQQVERQEPQPSDRDVLIERLAAEREASLTEVDGAEGDSRQREQQEEGKEKVRENAATDRKIRVKIDGDEQEVPLSELVKGYQKDQTASKRLEEASNRKKELDVREEELKAKEEQLSRTDGRKTDDATGDGADDANDDEVDAAIDALLEGDKTKFREILKGKGRQDTSTPGTGEDIGKIVDEHISQKELLREHAEAQSAFKKDYADIFGDPILLTAANQRYGEKLEKGMSIKEAMLEAGKETRDWLKEKAGVKETTTLAEKQRRKSNLLNLPSTGARSGSHRDDDNTPEDRSSVIQDIAKSRGQT